jgi:hypothetical protein
VERFVTGLFQAEIVSHRLRKLTPEWLLWVGSRRSAGAVVQALADAKPDAIFSSLFGADLQKFVAA